MKIDFSLVKTVAVLVLGLLIGSTVLTLAYDNPPAGTPPYCPETTVGCNPPINISGNSQSKAGALVVNNNGAAGSFGFIVPAGKVSIGFNPLTEGGQNSALEVRGGAIKAAGGLVIHTCAAANCPSSSAETGTMWLVQ